jgi:molybdate transport system regulatory protein
MPTRLTLRLDFDSGERLGPGKVALLEAIGKTGSIAAAGRELGMSYRRAWLLTDDLNHIFGTPLLETQGGGKNGGGAKLTALGKQVVTLYRAAEAKARRSAAKEIARMERSLGVS